MPRVVLASGVVLLLVVLVVAAQPVAPVAPPSPPLAGEPAVFPPVPPGAPGDVSPPKPPVPVPTAGDPSAPLLPGGTGAAPQTPLAKFEPLAAFPQVTQYAVRAELLAAAWMTRGHQVSGRFLYGYLPCLRAPLSGDNDLMQARAALALAQAARFSGDARQAANASHSALALLALTKLDPHDPKCLVPVPVSFVCNRVGLASLLVLTVSELPNPGDKLTDDAERLCNFLRTRLRSDGSVHYTDGADEAPTHVDPAGVNEFPGLALQALAASNRARPAEWKKAAVRRGVEHYLAHFRSKPHPALAATVIPAAAELFEQTKLAEAAAAAFEMGDWLCGLQIAPDDPRAPQWAGGFRVVADGPATGDPPGAADTGRYVQSLACAYQLTCHTGDLIRAGRYRPALTGAVLYLCGLQYLEGNTRHFENAFRSSTLIGAVHRSPTDGTLRIDATACAVTGLLRFLASGAERGGP